MNSLRNKAEDIDNGNDKALQIILCLPLCNKSRVYVKSSLAFLNRTDLYINGVG